MGELNGTRKSKEGSMIKMTERKKREKYERISKKKTDQVKRERENTYT